MCFIIASTYHRQCIHDIDRFIFRLFLKLRGVCSIDPHSMRPGEQVISIKVKKDLPTLPAQYLKDKLAQIKICKISETDDLNYNFNKIKFG